MGQGGQGEQGAGGGSGRWGGVEALCLCPRNRDGREHWGPLGTPFQLAATPS